MAEKTEGLYIVNCCGEAERFRISLGYGVSLDLDKSHKAMPTNLCVFVEFGRLNFYRSDTEEFDHKIYI